MGKLKKGEWISFLDYVIQNSLNNDGLVLFKSRTKVEIHESHLGNYGEGSEANITACKRDAVLYFMLARPEIFATTLLHKLRNHSSGTQHEWFLLKETILTEGLEMPDELDCSDDFNCMIYFNGKPIAGK